MEIRRLNRAVALAASLWIGLFAVTAHAAEPKPVSKWRIALNHTSDSDGAITFRIAPAGKDAIDVETKIPRNTGENHAAQILRDSLKASLGEGYHVEVDDGEDVLIKRRGDTPKFIVTMVSSSVTGLEV
ncbi:MAG TPA: hypothetical protein PKE27_11100, partial [Povalibacter sp.]|uniref:hypothetical protein n=1 Tax=Povalibacter sp. TaxID=1962978 RepID=UPI002C5CF3F3